MRSLMYVVWVSAAVTSLPHVFEWSEHTSFDGYVVCVTVVNHKLKYDVSCAF